MSAIRLVGARKLLWRFAMSGSQWLAEGCRLTGVVQKLFELPNGILYELLYDRYGNGEKEVRPLSLRQ